MLKRRNGSAGPGTNGDTDRKTKKQRLMVLRWWAGGFAVPVAGALSAATLKWFDDSGALWALVLVCAIPLVGGLNLVTVKKAHGRAPSWSWPWWRMGFGFCVAAAVAFALILWQFDDEVTAAKNAEITKWDREVPRLTGQLADAQKIATRPVSTVEADVQVQGKTAALAELKKEAARAKEDELCERAGTCGTRVQGEADAYYARRDWALEVERRVKAAEDELTALRAAVAPRVEQENRDRDAAVTAAAEIRPKLEAFGTKRPEPESALRGAWAASRQKPGPVGGWFVGGFLVCLLLDIGAFLFVVWRICRSEVWD
jgi:hypothetical protein